LNKPLLIVMPIGYLLYSLPRAANIQALLLKTLASSGGSSVFHSLLLIFPDRAIDGNLVASLKIVSERFATSHCKSLFNDHDLLHNRIYALGNLWATVV